MENRSHALAAGAFLLVMILAVVFAIAWFQGDRVERTRYLVVSRTGVAGLNVKAAVKLRGVDIGKVESIAFDPADPQQILVTIAVDAAAPLTRGTYAQLGLQGVTGLSFIDLSDSGTDATRLALADPPPRLELRPTLLDRLATAGPGLVTGLTESVTRLNTLLSDTNQTELSRSLAGLGATATQAQQLMAALQPAAKALPRLIGHADALVRRADSTLHSVDLAAGEAAALAQDLRSRAAVLDRLAAAAAQIETTTRGIELAVSGPNPVRTRPLVDSLSSASKAVERAAGEFGEQPQSLLFGRPAVPAGPGEPGFDAHAAGAH